MSLEPNDRYASKPMVVLSAPASLTSWLAAGTAIAALGAVSTATLAGVGLARFASFQRLVGERLEAIEAGARARSAADYVTPDKVELNCFASNSEVTCTATNRGSTPIATCVRGKLAKKQAAAVAIHSVPFCTGRLGQYETKTLSAQWKGAFARDICSSKTSLGSEILDFGECDFTTEALGAQLAAPAP
jgi:hypothetical protein